MTCRNLFIYSTIWLEGINRYKAEGLLEVLLGKRAMLFAEEIITKIGERNFCPEGM